jgi:flagellar protein FlbD
MVQLTRLNGSQLWLNPILIESVEATPDSVVTMSNGHKYIVSDKPDEIEHMLTAFYRSIGLIAAASGGEVER